MELLVLGQIWSVGQVALMVHWVAVEAAVIVSVEASIWLQDSFELQMGAWAKGTQEQS